MGDATCKVWDAEFQKGIQNLSPERRVSTTMNLMQALDTAMKLKAEVGLCKGKSMDECAKYKAAEYPKQTQKVMNAMSRVQKSLMKGTPLYPTPAPLATAATAATPAKPAKPAFHPFLAALAAKGAGKKYEEDLSVQEGLPAARPVGIFVASGLLSGAVVAGAALLVQRRRQHDTTGARLIAE